MKSTVIVHENHESRSRSWPDNSPTLGYPLIKELLPGAVCREVIELMGTMP